MALISMGAQRGYILAKTITGTRGNGAIPGKKEYSYRLLDNNRPFNLIIYCKPTNTSQPRFRLKSIHVKACHMHRLWRVGPDY